MDRKLEPLMTPKQVAETLGMKLAWTYGAIASGFIPGVLISTGRRRRSIRVRPTDLERWMKNREIRQPA